MTSKLIFLGKCFVRFRHVSALEHVRFKQVLLYCIRIGIHQHIMSGTCSNQVIVNFCHLFDNTSVYKRDAMIVRTSFYLFLKMVNWKSIFHWPFLLLMRNCLFIYFYRRLSHVRLIRSDVFRFLWWISCIINCLPFFYITKFLKMNMPTIPWNPEYNPTVYIHF